MKAYQTAAGNWQLNYTLEGKQRTLSLGRKYTAVAAERTAKIVTELVALRKMGEELPMDLIQRVGTLSERVRLGLDRGGLIQCAFGMSIGDLWEKFLAAKSHLKKSTIRGYVEVRHMMIRRFGYDRSIATITRNDIETFYRDSLQTLAPCTVSPSFRRMRTAFHFAVEQGFLSANPFDFKRERVDTNETRWCYVEPVTIRQVLKFCKNDRERLAVALGRFAGMRVPSELFALRFQDFTGNVIRVAEDTKTGFREVPILCDVREIFNRLTGKPDELIFTQTSRSWYRDFFLKAIARSEVKLWEKLWNNLRSSCITDFVRMGYDEKTLDAIFGNTAEVRRLHYIQFDKQRAYARVLADGERIFSPELKDEVILQSLLPVLREYLESRTIQ